VITEATEGFTFKNQKEKANAWIICFSGARSNSFPFSASISLWLNNFKIRMIVQKGSLKAGGPENIPASQAAPYSYNLLRIIIQPDVSKVGR
jgi:hypothetical protein